MNQPPAPISRVTPSSLVPKAVIAVASVGATTTILHLLKPYLGTPTVALLFLLPVLLSTTRWGLSAGIIAAVCSFLLFNFFFITPYYTFIVHHTQDVIVLIVFLIVAVVISQLVGRVKTSLARAQAREQEVIHLYQLSAELTGMRHREAVGQMLAQKINDTLQPAHIQVLLTPSVDELLTVSHHANEDWPARAADHLVPLDSHRGRLGEVRLWEGEQPLSDAEVRLLHALSGQGALALERASLAETETRATILEESDRLKSALLSSVSHDLRTPLASITGALSSLVEDGVYLDEHAQRELISTALEQAERLNRLVGNLLDMTRLETTMLNMSRKPIDVEDLIGVALQEMGQTLESYSIILDVPANLPPVMIDLVLISRVVVNVLDNAVKYSPPGSSIEIRARQGEAGIEIDVSDRGAGIPPEDLPHIFDKFYRARRQDNSSGTGLGLSLSKGFLEIHHGHIRAENRPGGGTTMTIVLPLNGQSLSSGEAQHE